VYSRAALTLVVYSALCRNDFSAWEQKLAKNNKNNEIQKIAYYYIKVKLNGVQWRLGQSPRSWGVFENNCCVKSNLVRLL